MLEKLEETIGKKLPDWTNEDLSEIASNEETVRLLSIPTLKYLYEQTENPTISKFVYPSFIGLSVEEMKQNIFARESLGKTAEELIEEANLNCAKLMAICILLKENYQLKDNIETLGEVFKGAMEEIYPLLSYDISETFITLTDVVDALNYGEAVLFGGLEEEDSEKILTKDFSVKLYEMNEVLDNETMKLFEEFMKNQTGGGDGTNE